MELNGRRWVVSDMDLFDIAVARKLAGGGSGGGGSSFGTLIVDKSLGHISTSSSSEVLVGSVTISDVADLYDMYLAVIYADEKVNNRHFATASMGFVYGASNRAEEGPGVSGIYISNRWNCMVYGNGNFATAQNGRGIYISDVKKDDNDITLKLAATYNSSGTKTIDNDYSIKVYGFNFYELITAE